MCIVMSRLTDRGRSMSNIILHVEFLAGTNIIIAAMEAKALACKLDLAYVEFNFNGVSVSIGQNADCSRVETKLHKAFEDEYTCFVENGRD